MSSIIPWKQSDVYCSIKPSNPKEAAIIHAAMTASDALPLTELVGNEVSVANLIVHKVSGESMEGKQRDFIRMVLLDDQGNAYSTCSDSALDCIAKAIALVGVPPWHPPMRFKVSERRTNSNRKTLILKLA